MVEIKAKPVEDLRRSRSASCGHLNGEHLERGGGRQGGRQRGSTRVACEGASVAVGVKGDGRRSRSGGCRRSSCGCWPSSSGGSGRGCCSGPCGGGRSRSGGGRGGGVDHRQQRSVGQTPECLELSPACL